MERSFARATRYGYKRARWRGLRCVAIQEYLTAAVQNIMVLLRYVKEPKTVLGVIPPVLSGIRRAYFKVLHYLQTSMELLRRQHHTGAVIVKLTY